jgi:hypothetical protein
VEVEGTTSEAPGKSPGMRADGIEPAAISCVTAMRTFKFAGPHTAHWPSVPEQPSRPVTL